MSGREEREALEELEELRILVEALHAGLDELSYFVFLGVPEGTDGDELRAAFHRRAQALHPDRFYALDDATLKRKVYAVYKRITEAYRVLGNPDARRRYLAAHTQGAVRLASTERPSAPRAEDGMTAPALKYYRLALDAERRGDGRSVRINLRLALQMDPDNPLLAQLMEKHRE